MARMTPSVFPDYRGQGIVNLMQSVVSACSGGTPRYPELSALPAAELAAARHIVVLVIDGLGQSTLERHADCCPTLRRHARAVMTSVFPSTTASAITTFMSGLAPAQHALTGWHIHFAEIAQTLAILPLCARSGELPPEIDRESLPERLCDYPTLFSRLDRECWVLAPRSIAGSPFNAWNTRGASGLAHDTPCELMAQIAALLADARLPRYVYAYLPELDSCSHRHGSDSEQARRTLATLDTAFGELLRAARGSDSWLIVTADHGFIDSPPSRVLSLDEHPQLAALLERPLCGERRAAYCYVGGPQRGPFEAYVRGRLGDCVDLRRSRELIESGCFGPPPYHPRLAARVGDYTLLMKDDWTIKDWLPGEKRYSMLGVHGGVSRDEMIVPLLAVRV